MKRTSTTPTLAAAVAALCGLAVAAAVGSDAYPDGEFGVTPSSFIANAGANRELLQHSSFPENSLLSDWPDEDIYEGRVRVVARDLLS